MTDDGRPAPARALQLAKLLRIVELRIAAKWREVTAARALEAQRERERAEQQSSFDRAEADVSACRDAIAEVRRGVFSPFDARGHRAALERLARARDQTQQALHAAQDRLDQARAEREQLESEWRHLRARHDSLNQLVTTMRKGAAIRRDMLAELIQDEDFSARQRPVAGPSLAGCGLSGSGPRS